jgi:hypothetical protein
MKLIVDSIGGENGFNKMFGENAFKEYQAIVTHNSILMDKQDMGKSGVVGSLPNFVFCD